MDDSFARVWAIARAATKPEILETINEEAKANDRNVKCSWKWLTKSGSQSLAASSVVLAIPQHTPIHLLKKSGQYISDNTLEKFEIATKALIAAESDPTAAKSMAPLVAPEEDHDAELQDDRHRGGRDGDTREESEDDVQLRDRHLAGDGDRGTNHRNSTTPAPTAGLTLLESSACRRQANAKTLFDYQTPARGRSSRPGRRGCGRGRESSGKAGSTARAHRNVSNDHDRARDGTGPGSARRPCFEFAVPVGAGASGVTAVARAAMVDDVAKGLAKGLQGVVGLQPMRISVFCDPYDPEQILTAPENLQGTSVSEPRMTPTAKQFATHVKGLKDSAPKQLQPLPQPSCGLHSAIPEGDSPQARNNVHRDHGAGQEGANTNSKGGSVVKRGSPSSFIAQSNSNGSWFSSSSAHWSPKISFDPRSRKTKPGSKNLKESSDSEPEAGAEVAEKGGSSSSSRVSRLKERTGLSPAEAKKIGRMNWENLVGKDQGEESDSGNNNWTDEQLAECNRFAADRFNFDVPNHFNDGDDSLPTFVDGAKSPGTASATPGTAEFKRRNPKPRESLTSFFKRKAATKSESSKSPASTPVARKNKH